MSYLLGLDIGTSGAKALLVHEDGKVIGSVTVEYPFNSPRPGWTEQDPEALWEGTKKAISRVLAEYHVEGKEIRALGLAGQMHSSVFVDREGAVIRPAILWNDGRTSKQCRQLEEVVGKDTLLNEACNPALEGFTLPKVLWLKENEPDNYQKVRWLLLVKDYIRYRLTGEIAMEISDAAGTLLLNVKQRKWSSVIADRLGISLDILPPLVESAEIAGRITAQAAQQIGIPAGTAVVGGGADNACGAVGGGVVKPGRAMLSLGTSGVILAHLEEAKLVKGKTIHMFNSAVTQRFYMMGVILSAGLSFRWFRDQLGEVESILASRLAKDPYALLGKQAKQSPPGSNGLLFLPYLTGERTPHADGNLRAGFFGLSAANTRQDMIRAVLEGVAFAFNDSVQLLQEANWRGTAVRAIGGGVKSPLWREIISSATGLQVQTLNIDEGPSFGAALLAGVGSGVFKDLTEAADSMVRIVETTDPNPHWTAVYQELYPIYQGLYPALKPLYDKLAETSQ